MQQVWWSMSMMFYLVRVSYALFGAYEYPWLERYHAPGHFTTTMTPYVNGTVTMIPSTFDTPDYRVEEPMFTIHDSRTPGEQERPYRNSPPYKQSSTTRWSYWQKLEKSFGCYCSTVYRKAVLVSACAVITTRHILTTATPTLLILKSYGHLKSLENIYGGWYDTDANSFNSSMYMTPSRIHIHPMYIYEHLVNVSHPIPVVYDLAIWAGTHTFYGGYTYYTSVIICPRAASGWYEYTSSIPRGWDMSVVIGYQFMKSYHRRPLPWYRYFVTTYNHVWPCPKSDWHWFHCVMGEYWGRFGFDSGGGMNTALLGRGWRYDGFIGLCSFSMKLRAKQTVHYFTVVDTHPVLDFLYDAMLGLTEYTYLDGRFQNTKWGAPVSYWGEYVYYNYEFGYPVYYDTGHYPKYRR